MAHKQRSIFELIKDMFIPEPKVQQGVTWQLSVDGACRGNPGPSGAGIFIKKNNQVHMQKGFFLGNKTNNEAEYLALVIGLLLIKKELHPDDTIHVISDSELLIRQMNKIYKVKKPELKALYDVAQFYLSPVAHTCTHVLREYNQDADRLANLGIDAKTPLPLTLLDTLRSHEIYLF